MKNKKHAAPVVYRSRVVEKFTAGKITTQN